LVEPPDEPPSDVDAADGVAAAAAAAAASRPCCASTASWLRQINSWMPRNLRQQSMCQHHTALMTARV
jgi:hypothetical protein